MVEVLISVTILSILLLSIATAFSASAKNYKENTVIAETMNAARQALTKMTTMIRTCWDVSSAAGTCSLMMTSSSPAQTFYWDNTDTWHNKNTLFYDTDANIQIYKTSGSPVPHKLCQNVTQMKFTPTPGNDSKGRLCTKSVLISMTVTIGDVSQTLSAAAVVMPNL